MILFMAFLSILFSFSRILFLILKEFDTEYYSRLPTDKKENYLNNFKDNNLKNLSYSDLHEVRMHSLMIISMLLLMPVAYFYGF